MLTVLNLFCGFYAIVNAFQGNLIFAVYSLVAGGIADAFDGKVARIVNGQSKFGIQYDSLADVVTFGVAPTTIIFNFLGQPESAIGLAVSFLPLLFASLRLARFNVQLEGFDKSEFNGFPSPAAAFSLVSVIFLNQYLLEEKIIEQSLVKEYYYALILHVIFFSSLMMSNFVYETMPNITFKGDKKNLLKLLLIVIAIAFLLLEPFLVFFPIMFLFAVQGIIKSFITRSKKNGNNDEKQNSSDT
jgi:CDP-diacylglycerol--serine O-phosphatidyltransferase